MFGLNAPQVGELLRGVDIACEDQVELFKVSFGHVDGVQLCVGLPQSYLFGACQVVARRTQEFFQTGLQMCGGNI